MRTDFLKRRRRVQRGATMRARLARTGQPPKRHAAPRREGVALCAFLGITLLVGVLSGCTRHYYRVRADEDVAHLLNEKADPDRWPLIDYYIYPHPYARFADLTGRPDHPPM